MKRLILIILITGLLTSCDSQDRQRRDDLRISALEKRISALEENKGEKASNEASRQAVLEGCIYSADQEYEGFIQANGTKKRDGGYFAPMYVWDEARKQKEAKIAECKLLDGK
jgi:hypothetical protein